MLYLNFMSRCESQEQEAFLAERDYVGLVSGNMEVSANRIAIAAA